MKTLLIIVLILVIWFFVHKLILSKFKVPRIGCLVPVTGGVKSGKSTFSSALTRSNYRANLRSVKFRNFFRKLFGKKLLPIPVIYSNVPLACDYVPVTRALLLRQEKPIPGSVCYLQEASLVADSQLIKDKELNNDLLLFFKLCGHQGLCVILDSQSTSDLHYAIKRSMSQTFYVRHIYKFLPFILIAEVIEYTFTEDASITFSQDKDTDDVVKRVLLPKSIWKFFDSRAYSVLTDDKPYVSANVVHGKKLKDLKARQVISFRPEFNINKEDI